MIEIVKLNKDLFKNNELLGRIKLSKYCYVNSIQTISNLLVYDLPIDNKRISLRNILDFLTFIDIEMGKQNSTILTITSLKLAEYFSKNKYKKYMKILKDLNILSDVPYEDGTFYKYYNKNKTVPKMGYSKRYRVHNEYLNKEDLCLCILDGDRSKFEFKNEIDDLDDKYIKTIKNIDINIKEAILAEINHCEKKNLKNSVLRNRISRIFYTKRKRYIKMGQKVNRIYHSISNLSRVSRAHLSIKFNELDIVNSQPLILAAYLRKESKGIDDNYQEDCENGNFYERFYDLYDKDFEDKDELRKYIKVLLYQSIFFSFNIKRKVNKRFKEIYPLTWNSLRIIDENKEKDGTLASKLQNIEASFFNIIKPEFSEYYFTLFDAIYFSNLLDKIIITKKLKSLFKQYGVDVKIK